ncbi:hypothetical protein UlMin_035315 [Ulmus minor]
MKRASISDDAPPTADDRKMKKIKIDEEEEEEGVIGSGFMNLDNNLLFEVLKHVDAKSLAMAACVSKQWHETAQDERLWELICTRQWANIGCGNQQLRSVVLALGGFRRLHSLYIWPLSKPQSSTSSSPTSASASSSSPTVASSSWGPLTPIISSNTKQPTRWGKDEVNLSLSLLSIRFYEKMNYTNRGR